MTSEKIVKIDGHEIELSNLDKVLFPKSGITKGDLISYYEKMSSVILPHYENRPLTMLRCPDGIQHQKFIQKEIPDYFPKWIERYKLTKKESHNEHALVNHKATLVYIANQACITFHLGLSKIDKIKYPNYLIFDLDPSTEDLALLKKVVNRVKELIDSINLKGFLQTTGSRGFHVYVPLKREYTFTEVHRFAKEFATYLAHEYSEEITIAQSKIKREKRVLIDYARNSYGLNIVAPYAVRAIENAPIATPLEWEELNDKDLHPQSYNLKNIFKRLSQREDPWKEINRHQVSLKNSIKNFITNGADTAES